MKPYLLFFIVAATAAPDLTIAQPVPRPDRPVVRPAPRARFDRRIVRERLAVPRIVEVPVRPRVVTPAPAVPVPAPAPAPAAVPAPAPPTTIEKTTTVTTTTTDGRSKTPYRLYKPDQNIVIVEEAEKARELSYVTVPVLFVRETAELLDADSAAALEETAVAIKDILASEPTAKFDIEGHTSTDGTDEFNMNLSAARAQRVFDELTRRFGVPANALSAHGYGENYPSHPNGTEDEMQLDRRVLVVRTQ